MPLSFLYVYYAPRIYVYLFVYSAPFADDVDGEPCGVLYLYNIEFE